jgi:hypothetical protein
MLKVKIICAGHHEDYPSHEIRCPKCESKMSYYSCSPRSCKFCLAQLDNMTKIVTRREGREEYYRSGACLFSSGDTRLLV